MFASYLFLKVGKVSNPDKYMLFLSKINICDIVKRKLSFDNTDECSFHSLMD